MADKSKIEWTDATWNPLRGCSRISPGCGGPNRQGGCYAEGIAARFSDPGQAFHGFAERTAHGGRWTGKVEIVPSALGQPLHWRKARRVFVNSMSDLFHESLPDATIDQVFAIMALAPRHTFQALTKRADRMRAYVIAPDVSQRVWRAASEIADDDERLYLQALGAAGGDWGGATPWPLPHVWLGVSVEDQERAAARIPELLATPAARRFLSCEPLLGPVDLHEYLLGFSGGHPAACTCGHGHGFDRCPNYGKVAPTCHRCSCQQFRKALGADGLHWVIAGGESGPRARPCYPDWIRALRDRCSRAKVPFFFKQWGEHSPAELIEDGKDPDTPWRQEPNGTVAWAIAELSEPKPWPKVRFLEIGKKRAGSMLDGREWREFPAS